MRIARHGPFAGRRAATGVKDGSGIDTVEDDPRSFLDYDLKRYILECMNNVYDHQITEHSAVFPWHGMRGGGPAHVFQGGGRERGGVRKRMFDAGELRLVLLLLIEMQPRHGYDLIRDIEERTGGAYAPSPGVIYPTLTLLEELEHIGETRANGPKRLFSIMPAGIAFLGERRDEAEAALARLTALGAENGRMASGPVSRAIQNLKVVLRQRLSSTQDKQTLFDVAELIDEAARKIERL